MKATELTESIVKITEKSYADILGNSAKVLTGQGWKRDRWQEYSHAKYPGHQIAIEQGEISHYKGEKRLGKPTHKDLSSYLSNQRNFR
jgi:hypothetical protein